MRTEEDVFQDLAQLCVTDGYAHVISHFCFRDNAIAYEGKLTAKNFEHQSSMERLVRTEISTLIGLMCKAEVSLEIPHPAKMQDLIDKTEVLLNEMHQTMMNPKLLGFQDMEAMFKSDVNPFKSGTAMREPFFYSGESAYDFQYRELAFRKYANDAQWFEKEKGFSLADVKNILDAVDEIQDEQLMATLDALRLMHPNQWTFLPAYKVSSEKLTAKTSLSFDVVERFMQAFSSKVGPISNRQFDGLNAFNQANAFPFIDLGGKDYLLFQRYSLCEAFYETPFFWMSSDKAYINEAMKNRGSFLEQYSAERLRSVFSQDRVYENVDIWGAGKQRVGEIDVLVIFANRAIVLQAKSKRLTLEARKGNDNQIKDDFKKSVQETPMTKDCFAPNA